LEKPEILYLSMKIKTATKKIIYALFAMSLALLPLMSQSVDELNKRAEEHFDKKEFSMAIALWLSILDIDPNNEKVQNQIEKIYDIKQRKDVALQQAKLNYRIARKILPNDYDSGKKRAKTAIDNYIAAYRIDPMDPELQSLKEDMRRLNDEISAEEEKRRLSRELQEKNLRLRALALQEMELSHFEKALNIWKEILVFLPQDLDAREGKRKCRLAIDNRIKFEKIREFMKNGKDFFAIKKFQPARQEFLQVLNLDPDNREAKNLLEDVDDELDKIRSYEQRRLQAEDFYASGIRNLRNNNFDQALDDLESVLALIDDYKDTKQRIAGIDGLRKKYAEKEKEMRLYTINREFQDGMIAFSGGQYAVAIAAFGKTLSLDPNNIRAKDYIQRAKDAQRLLAEEKVDRDSPYFDIVNSLIISGKSLYERGKFYESRKNWDNILKLFPKNKIATEYLLKCDLQLNPKSYKKFTVRIINEGKASLKKKNYNDALRKFELIKSIDKNYPGINGLIATARGGMRKRGVNLNAVDKKEIDRRLRLAANYYKRGGKDNYTRALREYRWVAAKDPENVQAIIGVNKIESQLRIVPLDRKVQKRKLSPRQRQLVKKYYYSGINYYSNNKYKRAIDQWRKVLAIDPTHVKAKNNIRKSLGFLGR